MMCREHVAQPAVSNGQAAWSWRAIDALSNLVLAFCGNRLECLEVASAPELFVGQERSVSLVLMSREHTERVSFILS